MDTGWTQELLVWLGAHPGWAGALAFVVACVESLVVIGIAIPGIVILFGLGAMIGLGAIDFLPIWLCASLGALLGDAFSFSVGHRYREHLAEMWPFSRYPSMLKRGSRFFHKHGAKSVVAGRFIGPLRPVIPVTAGMLGMAPGRFIGIAVPASIAWAPAYLLPGLLFGASLEMASEYTGRLTLVLIILVATLWLTLWLIAVIYGFVVNRSARWLRKAVYWTRRHPVFSRIAGPVLDPSQPEVLSVSMLGLLLVIVFWGFLLMLFMSPFAAQPDALDQSVLASANALRNHIADPFMVGISQLSRWWVLATTSAAVLLWLIGAGRYTAAAHWLVAMGGGAVLHALLNWTLRATPFLPQAAAGQQYNPSAAVTFTTVVLGFFAVMVAREFKRRHRKWPYLVFALLLSLVLLSRLYLGLDWFSGAMVGMLLGFAWTMIVGIAYRQRALKPFSGVVASAIFFGVLALTWSWQIREHNEDDLASLRLPVLYQHMQAEAWWDEGWTNLPTERTRSGSVMAKRFNLQLAVPPEDIRRILEPAGWLPAPEASWTWVMQALNPKPDSETLPLLSKDFRGHRDSLILHLSGPAASRQLALRIWDSGLRLQPGGQAVYLAQLTEEALVQRARLVSYWRSFPARIEEFQLLFSGAPELEIRLTETDLLLVRTTLRN